MCGRRPLYYTTDDIPYSMPTAYYSPTTTLPRPIFTDSSEVLPRCTRTLHKELAPSTCLCRCEKIPVGFIEHTCGLVRVKKPAVRCISTVKVEDPYLGTTTKYITQVKKVTYPTIPSPTKVVEATYQYY